MTTVSIKHASKTQEFVLEEMDSYDIKNVALFLEYQKEELVNQIKKIDIELDKIYQTLWG